MSTDLFDHFVGALQERQWDCHPERFLEVDDQLELCRLLNRQISRLRTLQNSAHMTRPDYQMISPTALWPSLHRDGEFRTGSTSADPAGWNARQFDRQ